MKLSEVVDFFENKLYMQQNANWFKVCQYDFDDNLVVNGMIDKEFVKRHCVIGEDSIELWREVDANVPSYIGC
jgi:hypothetical protein